MVGLSGAAAAWHDVENGAYRADLPLWRELAEAAGGPVLDLGAGTGRVALDLAARGHHVTAVDSDPELVDELRARAERLAADGTVTAVHGDVRELDLGRLPHSLAIAPAQLMQILGGTEARRQALRGVARHLEEGGIFAAAVARTLDALPADDASPPLPDMLERDGWVLQSQPLSVRREGAQVVVARRRQAVSPAGALEVESVELTLEVLSPGQLEREARDAGLAPSGRRTVPESGDHIGSEVVLCRR
jgi:SAM-dependent methyltransferase